MPDRVRDKERQERAAAEKSHLRRDDARVLGFVRRHRRQKRLGRVGHAQLRERRAAPDRAFVSGGVAGALPRHRNRSRLWRLRSWIARPSIPFWHKRWLLPQPTKPKRCKIGR